MSTERLVGSLAEQMDRRGLGKLGASTLAALAGIMGLVQRASAESHPVICVLLAIRASAVIVNAFGAGLVCRTGTRLTAVSATSIADHAMVTARV